MKKYILFLFLITSGIQSFAAVYAKIRINGVDYSNNSTVSLNCGTLNLTISALAIDDSGNYMGTKCQSNWSLPSGWQVVTDNLCDKEIQTNNLGEGDLTFTYVIYCGTFCQSTTTVTIHFARKIPTTPSISPSPILICSGGNQSVSASFTPFTYNYTWGSEGGVSVSSTGFASGNVTATSSGKAKVRADADPATGCPNSGWGEAYVHFGAPTVNGITVNTSMCSGYGQVVTANVLGNPTSLTWAVTSGNSYNAYLTDYGTGSAYFNSYVSDCYGLQISMSNSCGNSSDGTTICVDNCFARYSVYPNPVKEVISIDFGEVRNKKTLPERVDLFEEKSVKKVKSIDVREAFEKNILKTNGILTINVEDLPRGTYYLHIINSETAGDKLVTQRIVLN